jgi:MFS family permease
MKVKRGAGGITREEMKVIVASSAGTVFEWYDFFLYGSLAAVIGAQYFSSFPEATRNIFALLAFAAGFIVRPLGAIIFGRLGDRVGRKYTFLATITIMGLSTFAVGFLPGYASIGKIAPIILITLRILQGLALGGEYGGAVTYVAEHAPHDRRGYFTSFINSTATLGLLLSLIVILVARVAVGEDAFTQWGWRIPFLFSILLLIISAYIRLQMAETPAFRKIKEAGRQSKAPLTEAFCEWKNLKFAIATFLGLASGLTVIWYTAHFYTLFFLQNVLRVDMFTSNILVAWSLVIGFFAYVFFGRLSDKIGRKPVILTGFALAMISIFPAYKFITATANPQLYKAQATAQVSVIADPNDCTFQFNPAGTAKFTSSCDVAKALLTKSSVNYDIVKQAGALPAKIRIGDTEIPAYDAAALPPETAASVAATFNESVTRALSAAGYPSLGEANAGIVKLKNVFDIFRLQPLKLILALALLVGASAMAYAPAAAAMAELFPTRIRYTGMSLPYNLGTGWFGGLMPASAYAISIYAGNVYYGLWYPVLIVGLSFVVVALMVPERKGRDIFADD